jgi:hypothetical protein
MERNVCILDIECHHIPVTGSNGFKAQKWYNLEEHQQSCFIGCQYCTFKKHGFGELCCWNWLDNSASILRLILGLENFGSSFLDTLVCMLIMHAWVYNMYVCMCILSIYALISWSICLVIVMEWWKDLWYHSKITSSWVRVCKMCKYRSHANMCVPSLSPIFSCTSYTPEPTNTVNQRDVGDSLR